MFLNFFRFELKFWLRGYMVYVFLLVIGSLVFAATQSDNIRVGDSLENTFRNAPYNVQNFFAVMALLSSLMTAAFVNSAASREFIYNTDQILFAKPVPRFGYLLGRFWGSTTVALLPFLGISLGILLSGICPWNDPERWGPTIWAAHFWGLVAFALPNTIFISAIVFAIAVWTRSTMASFVGILLLLVGYGLSQSLMGNLDNEKIGVLLDPFGLRAFNLETKYWTLGERNSLYLTLHGMLLWNRLLWLAIGLSILAGAYLRFSFTRRRTPARSPLMPEDQVQAKVWPQIALSHGGGTRCRQLFSQLRLDFLGILKGTVFLVVMLAGLINMVAALLLTAREGFGLSALPVTYQMIDIVRGSMYLFLLGIVVFYAGVLVWRERDSNLDEVYDALPHPTWLSYCAKLLALLLVVVLVQTLGFASGVFVQWLHGYHRYQPELYLIELLGWDLIQFLMLMILAMSCHIVSPNKYVGYFLFVTLVILNTFAWNWLDITSNLVQYGRLPNYIYSDLFGIAPYLPGLQGFGLYWLLFGVLLSLVNILFWQRGREREWRRRWEGAVQRWAGGLRWVSLFALLSWLAVAGWVGYNTLILNSFRSPEQNVRRQVDYEQRFKAAYHDRVSPRVTRIRYEIDIDPQRREIEMRGDQSILNRSDQPISEIFVNLADSFETEVEIERCRLIDSEPALQVKIFRCDPPLQPGESLGMKFTVRNRTRGFENSVTHPQVVQNGTFFNNQIAPQLGYQPGRESRNRHDRHRYGLPPADVLPDLDPNNLKGRRDTYISNHSDWVEVETIISTSRDQVAVAPGSLLKSWIDGDRRYFHYRIDQASLNFFSFISARYQVARDRWHDVDVEVYYHPEHEWNVPKMVKSIHKTLDYCSQNFGPYRHRQARIIEFPRVAEFAQAFPGTMPYSEGIGFIADIQHDDDIDMVFYVVAHEMAHQWWAHQVAGANMKGATLLSETLAQYSALMVMEREYGRDMMRKFLSYEMDNYLRNRGSELLQEQPLLKVEANQGYVHYRKGSVVMYCLKELLGADRVNAALRQLIEKFGYQDAPYPTAQDLVDALRAQTPPELQYVYRDLFEQITLYGNRTTAASYRELPDGTYQVTLDIECHKFVADQEGIEQETDLRNEWIEIGAFAKPAPQKRYGETLYRQRVPVQSGPSRHSFIVSQPPDLVGVDPCALWIDRVPADNLRKAVRQTDPP